jgi:hypothetical protein
MSRLAIFTAIAYMVMFCCIPALHIGFLYRGQYHILFWILVFEYLVMIPLTIRGVMTSMNNTRPLLSFTIGVIVAAIVLLLVFFFTTNGMSDRGMGIIVFLIFPLVNAALIATGLVAGVVYIVKKVSGAY